jgi:hypothetical protein
VVTVVNHFRLAEPLPETAYEALRASFPGMRALGCRGCQVVEVSADHVILVLVLENEEAAAAVSRTYGGPWMNEHVRPRLVGDTDRSVGEAVVSLGF